MAFHEIFKEERQKPRTGNIVINYELNLLTRAILNADSSSTSCVDDEKSTKQKIERYGCIVSVVEWSHLFFYVHYFHYFYDSVIAVTEIREWRILLP